MCGGSSSDILLSHETEQDHQEEGYRYSGQDTEEEAGERRARDQKEERQDGGSQAAGHGRTVCIGWPLSDLVVGGGRR